MNQNSLFDGPIRNWNPAVVGLAAFVTGFLAHQLIGSLAHLILVVLNGGSLSEALPTESGEFSETFLSTLLPGNAIGAVLGLGVFAFLVARFQSTRPWAFLRVRDTNLKASFLSLFALLGLLPVLMWLGEINMQVPFPDWIMDFEEQQLAIMESILSSENAFLWNLLWVAVCPALFEEVLYRGVIQRNLERAWGIVTGIVVTGVLFGVIHMRFTQTLPLIVMGIFLCYLVWVTESLWVPVIVHFVNNALSVVFGSFFAEDLGINPMTMEEYSIPWYFVLGGLSVFVTSLYLIHTSRGTPDVKR